jgi:tetratricopeptide (TPR) repeat protein
MSLKIRPGHYKAIFNRAACYEGLELYDLALADYNSALELVPYHANTLTARASLYDKMGLNDQALEDFREAMISCGCGEDIAGTGDVSWLLPLLQRPQHPGIVNSAGSVISGGGDANTSVSTGTKTDPTDPVDSQDPAALAQQVVHILSLRSKIRGKVGDFHAAADDLSGALQVFPTDCNLRFSRGMVYKSCERYSQAVEDFTAALAVDENHIQSLVNRGYCYRKLHDYEKSIADYTEVIRRQPNNVRAYNNRAYAYAKLSRYEEAVSDYSIVISIEPDNAHAYHNRGISLDKIGRFDDALADFGKVGRRCNFYYQHDHSKSSI